jgi:hypothetical protein
MKNLVLSTLIVAAASQAAGCIFVSDDDPSGGLGEIQVTWNLKSTNAAGDTIAAGCPAGADTAKLFALPLGAPPASAFIDNWDCIDGTGFISDLDPDIYTVWVQLSDFNGTTRFAESFSQDITVLADRTATTATDIYVDRGFFAVGWNLSGRANRCSGIANGGVSILATVSGGADAFETLVNCEEGEGRQTVSEPAPSAINGTANYTVSLALLNQANPPQAISTPTNIPNRRLDYGNELEDLGIQPIVIP